MAGLAPASLPHLSLVFDATTGSSGEPAFLPHIGLVFEPNSYTLTAECGAFALTGQVAGLTYVPLVANVGDPAPLPHLGLLLTGGVGGVSDVGSFVFTGVAATLNAGRKLAGAAGSYTLTGIDATLTKPAQNSVEFPASLPHLSLILTGAAGIYSMPANVGSFAVSGNATLRRGVGVIAVPGTFLWTGAPAQRDMSLTAEGGQFDVIGWSVGLTSTHLPMTADAGAFTINGYEAGLDYSGSRSLLCSVGSFEIIPNGSTGVYSRGIQCEAGGYVISSPGVGYVSDGTFATELAAGVKGPHRRKRHYVEIDNQYFEVRDHEHAVEILTQLHEAAKEAAKAVKKAQNPPVMKIVKPDYRQDFVQDLQAQIDSANAQIAQMWREAEEAQRRAEDDADEEDVEALILAGVL